MSLNPFDGANGVMHYKVEVTRGVAATGEYKVLPSTGGMPQLTMEQIQSEEIGNGREITDIDLGNVAISGSITCELSYGSQDDLIANAMSSEWVAGAVIAAIEVTVNPTLNTYTRTAGDFIADGVAVGDYIQFKTLTGSNALPRFVSAVTETEITVSGVKEFIPLVVETATSDLTIGGSLKTGNLCPTMTTINTLKSRCGTVTAYIVTTGVEFAGWSVNIDQNANVSAEFPLIGYDQYSSETLPVGVTLGDPVAHKPYNDIVSSLIIDGVSQSAYSSFGFTNENSAAAMYTIGSDLAAFVERSNANNSISGSAYIGDTALLTQYRNKVRIRAELILTHPSSGSMAIVTPTTVLTEVTPERSAGSKTVNVSGTAIGDALNSSIILYRITA